MSDASPLLGLPYILPAQAQKHVTHNEAIRALDALVQLSVADRTRTAPPPEPAEGDRHLVAAGATGAWSGQDGKVAVWADDAGWLFLASRPGWLAWVEAEALLLVRGIAGWTAVLSGVQGFAQVGISATPNDTNRLAVSSPASLFDHAGAGHQMKINKALPTHTASLLFQTGYSGRAEMGTAGSDGFAIKVSADGATWQQALVAEAADGRVRLPGGLRVPPGAAADAAVAPQGDADTGLFFPAADQVALTAGGMQALLAGTTALTAGRPVLVPSGSAAAPGLAFSDNPNLGLLRPEANVIEVATAGVARARIASNGLRLGGMLADGTGIDSTLTVQTGGTAAAMAVVRYVAGAANGPTFTLARSKSATLGGYDAVTSGDWLGTIRFNGGDGTNLATPGANIRSTATATATAGDVRANLQLLTRGSDGMQVRVHVADGANVGIGTTSPSTTLHVNGPARVGSYTVATVPAAGTVGAGAVIHVSNESGGAVLAFSDGSTWRRVTDRAVIS